MTDPLTLRARERVGQRPYRGSIVRLDVCCNDPDNGLFDGRAAALSLPDMLMELGSHDFRGPVFRIYSDTIQVSRRRFAYQRSKDWFGNWCWNAYWLDAEDAIDLLSYVHAGGAFSCDQGEERMFARWRREDPFTPEDREFFARQWIKAMLAERSAA